MTHKRYPYDFSLDHSASRMDVGKYFARYGWPKTLKKLLKHQGNVTNIDDFHVDITPDYTVICYQYHFEKYFSMIELLVDNQFPFAKNLHILY